MRPGSCERLWVNDSARSLPWRVNRCDDEYAPDHIDVKEIRGALREIIKMAKKFPGSRLVNLMDSRVGIGACAKGRSASCLLNRELLTALPNIIGYDVHTWIRVRSHSLSSA